MAPTAARRAKPVQRSCSQGLQGNLNACHPGRGSACNETTQKTGGNAGPVFALSVQLTAAMGPLGPGPAGPGGFPAAFDIKSGAPAGQARSPGESPVNERADNIRPYESDN